MNKNIILLLLILISLVSPTVISDSWTIGYSGTSTSDTGFENIIQADWVVGWGNGTADNISVYLETNGNSFNTTCALYEYVDYSSDYVGSLIASTEEKLVPDGTEGWVVFNFSEPKPEIKDGKKYYIACWSENQETGIMSCHRIAESGRRIYVYPGGYDGTNWPDPMTDEAVSSYRSLMYLSYTLSSLGNSTTYYMSSSTGADSNNGTTPNSPWQNVSYLNGKLGDGTIVTGDDIYFKRGDVFTDTNLIVRTGGNESNIMTFGSYGAGAKPIITNTGSYCIEFLYNNVSYVTIEDLVLKNVSSMALLGTVILDNITIQNVEIYNSSQNGLFFQEVDTLTIENCTVANSGRSGLVLYGDDTHRLANTKVLNCTVYGTGDGDCIVLHKSDTNENTGNNHIIRNCTAYNSIEDCYDISAGENILMEDCRGWNASNTVCVIGHDISNITVQNCVFNDSNCYGLYIGDCNNAIFRNISIFNTTDGAGLSFFPTETGGGFAGEDGRIENCTVYNNDFVYPSSFTGEWTNRVVGVTYDYFNDIVVKNNIFSCFNDSALSTLYYVYVATIPPSNNITFDNNLWYNADGSSDGKWYNGTSLMDLDEWQVFYPNDTFADPGFVDADGNNLNLEVGSSCIESGSWLTRTSGSGTSTMWVSVQDASFFMDGYGMVDGDKVFVGDDTGLMITEVDYSNNSFKVDSSISWSDGENVSLDYYLGNKIDIGRYESPYSYTSKYSTEYFYPDSNGDINEFTAHGDTNQWECVDDTSPDENATYIRSLANTVVKTQEFTLDDHTTQEGDINYVKLYTRVLKEDSYPNAYFNHTLLDGDTVIDWGANLETTPSYVTYSNTIYTNNNTDDDFTWEDIDNLKVRLYSSRNINDDTELLMYPNANGDRIEYDHYVGFDTHWECVKAGDTAKRVYDNANSYQYDIFELDDHTTESYPIESVTVTIAAGTHYPNPFSGKYSKIMIKTGGTEYTTSAYPITTWLGSYFNGDEETYTWTNNPKTGVAWTWSDIDSLQAGGGTISDGSDNTGIGRVRVTVNIDEITTYQRFTQTYLEVNYTNNIIMDTLDAENPGENNITLNGELVDNAGTSPVECYFEYGTSPSFGSTTTPENLTTVGTFNYNLMGLYRGTTYYYRSVGINYNGSNVYGDTVSFTTRPKGPTNLTATLLEGGASVSLSWNIGPGSSKTVVVRSTDHDPTSPSDGDIRYNGTGSSFVDYPIEYGVSQFYRAWGWVNPFSSNSTNASIIVAPQSPYNGNSVYHPGTNTVNFTWSRGNGSSQELVFEKTGSYSTSVSDGTVKQNGTKQYYNLTVNSSSGYFSIWSYNSTLNIYSSTGLEISWGALNISVFNQSKPWQLVDSFGLLISNSDGSSTYSNTNCDNPILLNVFDIPYGSNTIFKINATNYKDTIIYKDLTINKYYQYDFYLAPIETEVDPGGGDPGGSGDNYSTTQHYVIQVIDELNNPVQDADVTIRFYNNFSETWEDKSSFITDGYGQGDIWLVPGVLYKVNISATGYISITGQDWTPVYIEYSDDRYKTFQLEFEDITPQYPDNPFECISLNGEIGGNTLYINFSSTCGTILDVDVYVYEINLSSTATVLFGSYSDSDNFSTTLSNINNSNNYLVICFYNHSYWGNQTITFEITGTGVIVPPTSSDEVEGLLNPLFGYNPFGWHNFLMFLFLIAGFFYADQRDAGKILILMGGLMLFLNIWIGFNSLIVTLAGGVVPVLFIIAGLMSIWKDSNKKEV